MFWFSAKKAPLTLQSLHARAPQDVLTVLARAGVPGFREAVPLITTELTRARRYGRSLTVALFGIDGDGRLPSVAGPQNGTGHGAGHGNGNGNGDVRPHGSGNGSARPHPLDGGTPPALYPAILAALLREISRDIDIVTYAAALGSTVVVFPEVGQDEARLAVSRLTDWCGTHLQLSVRAEGAVFPQDGLTLEELLRVAHARSRPSVADALLGAPRARVAY